MSPFSLKFSKKGEQHARRKHQDPTQGLSRKAADADRTRRLARRQRRGAGNAWPADRHRRIVGQGQPARRRRRRTAPLVRHRPPRRNGTHQLRRPADGSRIHLADPRPAADRRPSAQGRRRGDRADQGAAGQFPLRDLHFAVLPQLPGRRAGAEPDGRAQSRRQPHDDRRRAVPGRSRGAPDHGGADHVPERRGIRRRAG